MWMIALIVGCGGPAECGPEECADICAEQNIVTVEKTGPQPAPTEAPEPTGSASMTTFENELLGPVLDDLREGVRPFGPEGIGVCKAKGKECEKYLGMAPEGELGEGDHQLKAELAVPRTGEKGTWKVKFDLDCTITKKTANGETKTNSTQNREYDVIYAGKERGYRLRLWTMKSPNKYGRQDCTYVITGPHPDGDKVYEGRWTIPAAE